MSNPSTEEEIQNFTKTLVPTICNLTDLYGNQALTQAIKQAMYDRRDAYLKYLKERQNDGNNKQE